ncbi:hypothetical protein ABEV55_18435 [Aneurinibacillus thermoaerophilus]|jgi:hypothetical protein|uniref:hypothetical protein n=1 Tax=Aneurinibacillus thermoaerophilus TaxID=143495 RepID=UPI002E1D61EA|nr:hypothetical protein [Aneurinibacillus thermoaerophilus]
MEFLNQPVIIIALFVVALIGIKKAVRLINKLIGAALALFSLAKFFGWFID